MYKLTEDAAIIRLMDGAQIPPDPANRDYAEYLAWVAAGGSPQPANQPSTAELMASAKEELRALRAPMLNAVNGIGWRASMTGNTALANEAAALAEALLDITADPALNAATNYDDMRAAGVAAYKRIAMGASPELAKVFREITGA